MVDPELNPSHSLPCSIFYPHFQDRRAAKCYILSICSWTMSYLPIALLSHPAELSTCSRFPWSLSSSLPRSLECHLPWRQGSSVGCVRGKCPLYKFDKEGKSSICLNSTKHNYAARANLHTRCDQRRRQESFWSGICGGYKTVVS